MLIYWDGEQVQEHTKIYVARGDACVGHPCIDLSDTEANLRYGKWTHDDKLDGLAWDSIPVEQLPKQLRTYELLLGGVST